MKKSTGNYRKGLQRIRMFFASKEKVKIMKAILRNLVIVFILSFLAQGLYGQNRCYIEGPEYIPCPDFEELFTFYCVDGSNYKVELWEIFGPYADLRVDPNNPNQVSVSFYESGSYLLQAYVPNSQGNIDSFEYEIYVDFGPQISINGCHEYIQGCLAVCTGSSTIFSVEDSQITIPLDQWRVTGAESVEDLGTGIEVTWGEAGPGSVRLDSLFFCGETSFCVRILAEPTADFDATRYEGQETIEVCRNEMISFKNLSLDALEYNWNFGDGNISSDSDPEHSFDLAGTYTVTLNALSVCSCADEKEITVVVLDAAAPVLDCIHTVCPETRQVYTATTDGCQTFDWSISNNGTITRGGGVNDDFIEVIWHSGPDGIIDLLVSSCNSDYCSKVSRFRVPVISEDGPLLGDQSVCSGELVRYNAPNFPGAVYKWNLSGNGVIVGDASRYSVTVLWSEVNAASNATLKVEYDNCFLECGGSDEININITPNVRIEGDAQVCKGQTATAQAVAGFISANPASVDWELQSEDGDVLFTLAASTNFTVTFNFDAGVYYWVAINNNSNYCNNITKAFIEVVETPEAPLGILGETEICSNIEYGYSIQNSGNYSTQWTITDGVSITNYTGSNIRHTFGPTPPYSVEAHHIDLQNTTCVSPSVTLLVMDGIGNEINGKDSVCHESIEKYSMGFVNGAQYTWSITPESMGELLRSQANEAEVFWSNTGIATLQIEACGKTIRKEVFVQANPAFNILGTLSTCGDTPTSIQTDQSTLNHIWRNENEFVVSTDPTADLLPGYYSVEVIDELGCSSNDNFQISSLPYPEVNVTSPDQINCSNISSGVRLVSNTDGTDYTFQWYRDSAPVGTGPSHLANSLSKYFVDATNEFGCTSRSRTLDIEKLCEVDTSDGGSGCSYLLGAFNFNVNENSCSSKEYLVSNNIVPGTARWYISSISESNIASFAGDVFTHEYKLPGYYWIDLRAELDPFNYGANVCGHVDRFIDSVLLVADFENTEACVNTIQDFNDLSTTLPGYQIASWSWDFGDPLSGINNTSNLQNPQHLFSSAGSFTVVLTTTTTSGCVSQKTGTVRVHEGPDIMVDYDLLNCEETSVSFEITDDLFDLTWDFDDPTSAENTATKKYVLHEYAASGNYLVTVGADNIYGCRSNENFNVEIHSNNLAGDIFASPALEVCHGNTIQLNAPPGGENWLWNSGETTNSIRVTATNQYGVFITDQYNCQYEPASVFVNILPQPEVSVRGRLVLPDGEFGPWRDSLSLCEGEAFELQVYSGTSVNFDWNNGETVQSLVFDGTILDLPSPGLQDYTVIGTDVSAGCESEPFTYRVEIFEMPNTPQILLSSGSFCAQDQNVLEVIAPDPNLNYVWSNGELGTSITVDIEGRYFVYAVNDNGCRILSNDISIRPAARVDLLPAGCFDLCDPHLLCLPNLAPISNYTIYLDGTSVSSGTTWPNDYLIEQSGTYTFELSTTNGCSVTSDPFDVQLYPGLGVLTTEVLVDVDGDGQISAADTLITGIDINLYDLSAGDDRLASTLSPGLFDFTDLPIGDYMGSIDRMQLHTRWTVLIDSVTNTLVNCHDSVVVQLLIGENCIERGPDLTLEVCEGVEFNFLDSTWISPGQFEYHSLSQSGCDSINIVELKAPDSVLVIINIWYDTNGDGMVNAGDTLMPNIDFNVDSDDGILSENLNSGGTGSIDIGLLRKDYLLSLDRNNLPNGSNILIDSLGIESTDCDTAYLDLLIGGSCEELLLETHIICPGDSIYLFGQWYADEGKDSLALTSNTSACDTMVIIDVSWFDIDIEADLIQICEQSMRLGSIELSVTGNGPFDFDWGPDLSNTTLLTDLSAGSYQVSITDANACNWLESFEIQVVDTLEFNIDPVFVVLENGTEILEITGDVSSNNLQIEWNPTDYLDCGTCFITQVTPLENTEYNIIIIDENGCPYELKTSIDLVPDVDSTLIFTPTSFTPNNDNMNDRFKVYSPDEASIVSFAIFSRWGNKVYEERNIPLDQMIGWDGNYGSKEMNSNVFLYTAEIELSTGERIFQQGDITLVR